MIRHAVSEGLALLRGRAWAILALAVALAVPIAVGGSALNIGLWLRPLLARSTRAVTVQILLRPGTSSDEVRTWAARQMRAHPGWRVEPVPPDELARRLIRWFPYLKPLLAGQDPSLIPNLVEVRTPDPDQVDGLVSDPLVLAVGPRATLARALRQVSRRLFWVAGGTTAVLLLSAALLSGIWIHLELYRHADEIAIMRLVGATEPTVRGPFLFAVLITGGLSGLFAAALTALVAGSLTRITVPLGLPPVTTSTAVVALQIAVATGVPLAVAFITLARHAALEIED